MSTADARLAALHGEEWAWRTGQLGEQARATLGAVDDFLPDVGEQAQQERLHYWERVLDRLAEIPVTELSPAAQEDHAVYQQQLRTLVAQQRFRVYERPVNADTSFWSLLADRARRRLETVDEARRYLRQLADIPRFFAQHSENMRAGLSRGFAPVRVCMQGRDATIRTVVDAPSPENLRFFAPFENLPEQIPKPVRDELREQARVVLRDAVVPAHRDLLAFVTQEYLPRLPTDIAASSGPDGPAFYRAQLREFTTTDLEPEQIFEIGMAEVASIRSEMEEIATRTGFTGDLPGLLAFLRTDPRFYATTRQQLLREAAWQAKKFDARVHHYFGRVPRMRFGIDDVPADLAPFYTFGRGHLDRYVLNTSNLPARPLYALAALTLHEAAPGHAFQTSLALEQTRHPQFRRTVYVSAYGEGWALYCERLGVEMGMYDTPFELMGMLSFQMWRAARLVVDPGMHALGWSREQAQAFLRDNTAIAEHEIVTEVDRYITWPGQATAYHIGQLTILELRRRAENALGPAFRLRDFHDAVLALGSAPLTVLEHAIDRFIAGGGRSPFSSTARTSTASAVTEPPASSASPMA